MTKNKFLIDKLVKTIARFGDVQIKHAVALNYKNPNKKDFSYQHFGYMYNTSRKVKNENTVNVMYKTYDNIVIEQIKKLVPDPNNPDKKIYDKGIPNNCLISYNDCEELHALLEEGERWLKSEEFKGLFGYTDNGKPFRINSAYVQLHHIMYPKVGLGKFLVIQPYIIQEMNNTYTGISLKTERGVLGALTASEFLNMKKLLISVTNSLYSDSLQLVTMGLTHNLG